MFKAIQIYTVVKPWALPAGALEEKLLTRPLNECSGLVAHTCGWVPAAPEGQFAFGHERHTLAMYGNENKILPSSVVNREVDKRAAKVEQQMGFKPGRKQRREIKEQVIAEFLPKAFAKRGQTRIWIDAANSRLIIGSGSIKSADEITTVLRDTLGTLDIEPIQTEQSISALMTKWVQAGEAPEGFDLDGDAELTEKSEASSTVRYARFSLESKNVREHIEDGKVVKKLSLIWRDRVRFVLNDAFGISRIKFEEVTEVESDKREQEFDQDVAFSLGTLALLLDDLSKVCGVVKAAD